MARQQVGAASREQGSEVKGAVTRGFYLDSESAEKRSEKVMETKTIWFDAAVQLPDDETTVLIALDDGEVWTGYVEGDQWLYVTGDPMEAKVTHWQHLPCPPLRGAA